MEDPTQNDDIVYSESRGCLSSYSKSEMRAFASYLNQQLKGIDYVKHILPIIPENPKMFEQLSDGLIYAAMVNEVKPGTVSLGKLAVKKEMNIFQKISNYRAVLSGIEGLGIKLENMHAETLAKGPVMLNLGLTWMVVKNMVLHVDMGSGSGKEVEDAESRLMAWFNEHIQSHPANQGGKQRRVTNWSGDLKDSTCYGLLLSSLLEDTIPHDFFRQETEEGTATSAFTEEEMQERAELIIQVCREMGIESCVEPEDIVRGSSKINLLLTAEIYNNLERIEQLDKERKEAKRKWEEEKERERKEKEEREEREKKEREEREERERIEKEEREREEKERAERERQEQERQEKERQEKERQEREEREEQERLQREQKEKEEKEEEIRKAKEREEQEEKERQTMQDLLRLEAERLEEEKIKVIKDINELREFQPSQLPFTTDEDGKQIETSFYTYVTRRLGLDDQSKTDEEGKPSEPAKHKIILSKAETESLFNLLASGVVLANLVNTIFDSVSPESVPLAKLEQNPRNIFQKISNCQLALKGMQEAIDKSTAVEEKGKERRGALHVETICSARNVAESNPKKSVIGLVWLLRQFDWVLNRYSVVQRPKDSEGDEEGSTKVKKDTDEIETDLPSPKATALPKDIPNLVERINRCLKDAQMPDEYLVDETSFTLQPHSLALQDRKRSTNIQSGRTLLALLDIVAQMERGEGKALDKSGVLTGMEGGIGLLESIHTKDNLADYEINVERIRSYGRENSAVPAFPGSNTFLEMNGPRVAGYLEGLLALLE